MPAQESQGSPPCRAATLGRGAAPSSLGERDRADGKLAAARIVPGIEHDLLAFAQRRDAGALQRGGVYKHVLLSVVRLDESEASLAVVEFYCARSHAMSFRYSVCTWAAARTSRVTSRFVDLG